MTWTLVGLRGCMESIGLKVILMVGGKEGKKGNEHGNYPIAGDCV